MQQTHPLHILIIGGGIGGLCLAQGLHKAGISVSVYERDHVRTERLQGYRFNITPLAREALKACLPVHLYSLFLATSGRPIHHYTFLNTHFKEVLSVPIGQKHEQGGATSANLAVSRITLRNILLFGLEERVHFGKQFVRYEQSEDGQVTAFFSDGTSATGSVLVAADGANSRVRQQFLPHARRVETGVFAIAGKVLLSEKIAALLPESLFAGPGLVLSEGEQNMFLAVQQFSSAPQGHETDRERMHEISDAQKELVADNTQDYLLWVFAARRGRFPSAPEHQKEDVLREIVLTMVSAWHPFLQEIVRQADPTTILGLTVGTSTPIAHWKTTTITLLGDAIHSMTFYRGIGANTALRDAALLCQQLIHAQQGEKPLLQALSDYELTMLEYGFDAVRRSLRTMQFSLPKQRIMLALLLRVFTVLNRIPPLKQRMFRRMGAS